MKTYKMVGTTMQPQIVTAKDSIEAFEKFPEATAAILIKDRNPIQHGRSGAYWQHQEGDIYVATGVLVNGRRFKPIRSSSWRHIQQINLYRGTKWLERDGKRYRIQTVWN